MKNLILIRHADTHPQQPVQDDKQRQLTSKGHHQIKNIAQQLKELECFPDYLLCSPAKRAIQTSKILCQQLNIDSALIHTDSRLYRGELVDILPTLRSCTARKLFIIGHNPTISSLAHLLCSATKPIIFPTAGVISLEFNIEDWSNLSVDQGKLIFFIKPSDESDTATIH